MCERAHAGLGPWAHGLGEPLTEGYKWIPGIATSLEPTECKIYSMISENLEHDGGKRKFQLKSGDLGFGSMPGSWVRSLPSLIQGSVFPQLSPTWPRPVPTPCSLTMRLVCVTGLGSISCNPLFGYLGSGYLPLWDRGAQRDYAPCSRPQNLEHQGQDRNLGF